MSEPVDYKYAYEQLKGLVPEDEGTKEIINEMDRGLAQNEQPAPEVPAFKQRQARQDLKKEIISIKDTAERLRAIRENPDLFNAGGNE